MNLKKLIGNQKYRNTSYRISDNEEPELKNLTDYDIVNTKFNVGLQFQIDGTLPKDFIYELGMPSKVLLFAGIENLPIEMLPSTLTTKSDKSYIHSHPFDLIEIKNLPLAIQKPIAVFDTEEPIGNRKVILTELLSRGNNFIALIDVIKISRNGRYSNSINSIISLYPKDSLVRVAKWFDSEFAELTKKGEPTLLKWADIKKASCWLNSHASDVRAAGLSPKRIANIINSFYDYQFS